MKRYFLSCAAVLAIGLASQYALPQTPPPIAPSPTAAETQAAEGIDPLAISALEQMVQRLGTLKTFEVRTRTSIDHVLANGQKIQMDGGATYRVRRPDGFFIETSTDRRLRQFFYDGKTFTMFSPRMNVYAQVAAPPTISQVLQKLEDEYDVSVPLNDLFHWGSEPTDVQAIKAASRVGYAKVGGADCDQFAFRQEGVDWQIWIQKGDNPLPRKLVITTLEEPSQPQYVAYLDWDTNARIDGAVFDFKPPKDTYKIEIRRVSDAAKPSN
ncbi:MAG TPA: DUF2092 domain-containing protein [Hyphomonadaceae bacterium]|jgi:hypothetical protein